MNKPIFFGTLLASMFAVAVSTPAPAQVDPASLAQQELAAESRGDVTAALALYSDDAIVQYGGLCWTPCVGKAAIQKEMERRVAAKNRWTIIGKYVSGNVAVVQTELQIGYIEKSRRGPSRRMEHLRGEGRQDRGRHLGGSAHGPANCPLYRMVSVAAAGEVAVASRMSYA
jgi:hypothetical protein